MRRLITVPYFPAAPVSLPSLNAVVLTATTASSSSISLSASYSGPPSAASYTFYQYDPVHSAWVLLVTQAGPALAVNGLNASTQFSFAAAANTAESPSRQSAWGFATATTAGAGHQVQWNPGHYMLSNEVDRTASGQITAKRNEQTVMLASGSNVLGWWERYLWGLLDVGELQASLSGSVLTISSYGYTGGVSIGNVITWPGATTCRIISSLVSPGVYQTSGSGSFTGTQTVNLYDFSHIDADIAASSPKLVGIQVASGYNSATNYTPSYIVNNAAYGASPTGGQYGFWTMFGGSGITAAIWRASVMGKWTALHQALGFYYNANPSVCVIGVGDESVQGSNLDGGSDYSDAGQFAQWQALETAAVAACPNKNWSLQNNFFTNYQRTADLLQDMYSKRVAFDGPDIYGATLSPPTTAINSFYDVYALSAYMGIAGTTPGTDYRGKMAFVHSVQSPELSGVYASAGGPQDIATQIITYLKGSMIAWNYIGGTGKGNWTGGANSVLSVINANPIQQTTYPASYP